MPSPIVPARRAVIPDGEVPTTGRNWEDTSLLEKRLMAPWVGATE